MKIKTKNKSSQTARRCTGIRLHQILAGVRSIALEGALDRIAKVRQSNAALRTIAHGLWSIAITEWAPAEPNVKLEQKIRLSKIENNEKKKKPKQKLKIKLNVIPKN